MSHGSIRSSVDWIEVEGHYQKRASVGMRLRTLLDEGQEKEFAELAIGQTEDAGNYSAAEHPVIKARIILNNKWQQRVAGLAKKFISLQQASEVPILINEARLDYLKISVGSELSCMVNPQVCWVCNVRTIWTHVAWESDPEKAEELLKAFRIGASDAEMAYSNWVDAYHPYLGSTLNEIAREGSKLAAGAGVKPGELIYLWADAIASQLYGDYHKEGLGH